ncbi:PREDICTED: ecdysone 20-monooxygenase, partial [Nicrophorus vespilloides]|uniref:Ecdysone 20-monooxygenase n=1 Tax=Nicrophorus vespilloides TaxID=110193 RepID=A0ABM1MR39_NICVS
FEVSLLVVMISYYLFGQRSSWKARLSSTMLRHSSEVPGPLALPVFGSCWVYTAVGGYSFTRVHEFYRDMFLQHGPIVKEEALWNVPVISVVERSDIEKVFRSSGRYPIRPPTEAIAHYRRSRPDRYASTGMVNEQGASWYHLRSNLTSHLTSTKTIASFLPQVEEICGDWCSLLDQLKDPKDLISNVEVLASRLGLEAICSLVLGRRMGFLYEEADSKLTYRLAHAVSNHFGACRDTYYGLPLWKLFPTPAYKKLVESEEEIYNLVLEIIESADEASMESAVFQSVLKADVDSREKTAAIVDFIAAGIYTMRNSMVFLLNTVANDPKIQEAILQDPTGAYAKACVNETFRLLPTANCLARVIENDLELSNYRIPKHSVVLCHTGLACRDDRNFPQAEKFIPERWLDDAKQETTSVGTYLVVPFGIGRRTCPGKRFIEQILPIALQHTVRNFKMANVNPLEVQFEFLLAPKGPINMVFEKRF